MELNVKLSFISTFSPFFLVFKRDFIRRADFTVSQFQTQQVMTSQIRSHVEYLIHTYYMFVLIL